MRKQDNAWPESCAQAEGNACAVTIAMGGIRRGETKASSPSAPTVLKRWSNPHCPVSALEEKTARASKNAVKTWVGEERRGGAARAASV